MLTSVSKQSTVNFIRWIRYRGVSLLFNQTSHSWRQPFTFRKLPRSWRWAKGEEKKDQAKGTRQANQGSGCYVYNHLEGLWGRHTMMLMTTETQFKQRQLLWQLTVLVLLWPARNILISNSNYTVPQSWISITVCKIEVDICFHSETPVSARYVWSGVFW